MPRGGGKGVSGGLSKHDAFFESIRTENLKTLHWSLRAGGFSPTKPFEEESQLPPVNALDIILCSLGVGCDGVPIAYNALSDPYCCDAEEIEEPQVHAGGCRSNER